MTIYISPSPSSAKTYFFVGSDFPVLSELGPDGTLSGIGIEIVRIICKRLGHTPKIELYPWPRAQAMVKSGEADVLIAPYKTPAREKWLDFSATPFFEDNTFFFVQHGSTVSWNGDLKTMRDKRIGMVPGWSVGAAFEKAKPLLTIDYAPNLDVCFRKLIAGRVDLVPTQLREAIVSFHRLGLKENEMPETIAPVMATDFNYFGFSRKKRLELHEFKKAFELELKEMYESGDIAWNLQPSPSLVPKATATTDD